MKLNPVHYPPMFDEKVNHVSCSSRAKPSELNRCVIDRLALRGTVGSKFVPSRRMEGRIKLTACFESCNLVVWLSYKSNDTEQ